MRPAVSAAMDLRCLASYRPQSLVKGLLLAGPEVRAVLRRALDEADSGGMSVISVLGQAVEKVFADVEQGVEDIDGAALADARRLITEALAAESQVVADVSAFKADIAAAVAQYGPEAVAAVEAEIDKLIALIQGLLHAG